MKIILPVAASLALLAGCSPAENGNVVDANAGVTLNDAEPVDMPAPPAEGAPDTNATGNGSADAATPLPTDAWTGKWVGVEGLALDINKLATPGQYDLAVTLMDGTDQYVGKADGDVITFTRNGVTETIRKVRGSETGLKYLADKQNCLMIKSGEGFCR